MYHLYDTKTDTLIFKSDFLNDVKKKAQEVFGPQIFIDGDFDLGAYKLYIFNNNDLEEEIGYIEK